MANKYIRLWEEAGKYYLSDQYDLDRVVFGSQEERQVWMNDFISATGRTLIILPLGKIEDRSLEGLMQDQIILDAITDKK